MMMFNTLGNPTTTSTQEPTTSTPDPTTSTLKPTASTPKPATSTPQPTTSTPEHSKLSTTSLQMSKRMSKTIPNKGEQRTRYFNSVLIKQYIFLRN